MNRRAGDQARWRTRAIIAVAVVASLAPWGAAAGIYMELRDERADRHTGDRTINCVVAGVLEASRDSAIARGRIDQTVRLSDGRVVRYRELYERVLGDLPQDCPPLIPPPSRLP